MQFNYSQRLSSEVIFLLSKKYTIVEFFDLMHHDHNTMMHVLKKHNNIFNKKNRILILHDDTDYYLPHVNYGLLTFNIYQLFFELNIPLSSIIFITNHYGIKKEFELLSKNINDVPLIIDDMITFNDDISNPIANCNTHIEVGDIDIKYNMLCMMGKERVHRNALYNYILHKNLTQKIHTTFHKY